MTFTLAFAVTPPAPATVTLYVPTRWPVRLEQSVETSKASGVSLVQLSAPLTADPDASRNVNVAVVAMFQGVLPLAGAVREAVFEAPEAPEVVLAVVSVDPPPPQPARAVRKTSAATRLSHEGVVVLAVMVPV
jgi:hypothetical protein